MGEGMERQRLEERRDPESPMGALTAPGPERIPIGIEHRPGEPTYLLEMPQERKRLPPTPS